MDALQRNDVAALAAVADPVRRALYAAVAASDSPVSRDDAATAAGVPRSTAALHLDRLVDAGLLSVESRRLSGRTGPGAGRPAKLYSLAPVELIGSLPERHYELVAELLAASADVADRDGIPMREALATQARETGTAIATSHLSLDDALTACGYEPRDDGAGGLLLDNCPFHTLARRHTELVCGANLHLVAGMVDATADEREARLEPRAGHCCVALRGAAGDSARA